MKITVVIFCLTGAIFASPISFNVSLKSNELDANTTESLSVSQSSENNTSELQSSEETDSNQSSESESSESTSEDKTSEESNSQSDEDDGTELMAETRDNSIGSEENVRKSLVEVFASIIQNMSAEDNSTEVKGQTEDLSEEQPLRASAGSDVKQRTNGSQSQTTLLLVKSPTDSSDTSSESSETSDITAMATATTDSTSSESDETSDSSDSSDASKSAEDSEASDSTEQQQIKTNDCVNGTESCESEEDFFQAVGDDPHYHVDNLMVPDEDERELSLRR